jgi:hypothetical protein
MGRYNMTPTTKELFMRYSNLVNTLLFTLLLPLTSYSNDLENLDLRDVVNFHSTIYSEAAGMYRFFAPETDDFSVEFRSMDIGMNSSYGDLSKIKIYIAGGYVRTFSLKWADESEIQEGLPFFVAGIDNEDYEIDTVSPELKKRLIEFKGYKKYIFVVDESEYEDQQRLSSDPSKPITVLAKKKAFQEILKERNHGPFGNFVGLNNQALLNSGIIPMLIKHSVENVEKQRSLEEVYFLDPLIKKKGK